MPGIRDLLPPPPWAGPPLPRGILRKLQAPVAEGELIPYEYRYLIPLTFHPRHPYYIPGKPDNPDNPAMARVPRMTTKDLVMMLKDGVEHLVDSREFREYLTAMSKFHNYSISNQMLILLQKPNATHVAGYVRWKDLGRWVIKDAKGIGILAPIFARKPRPEEIVEDEELDIAPSPIWYMVVYVFDISQTEGKPLPEFEVPVLTGEANEELFVDLLALMKRRSVQVSFDSRPHLDPSIKGHYLHDEIWVRPEEPRAQQVKTLTHEVAHYYSAGVFRIPRRDAETIAESAAYVVGANYGFDTGVRSFPYVALWAQDKKVLNNNLKSIHKVVDAILEGLGRAEKEDYA